MTTLFSTGRDELVAAALKAADPELWEKVGVIVDAVLAERLTVLEAWDAQPRLDVRCPKSRLVFEVRA